VVQDVPAGVCPQCGESYNLFGEGVTQKAAKEFGIKHLGSLPLDPRIISFSDRGTPFVVEDPESKAAKAFGAVVDQLSRTIGIKKKRSEKE